MLNKALNLATPSGDMTLSSVAAWHDQFAAASRQNELPEQIDLSAIDRADTSALALLLEVETWARAKGGSIRWVSPPQGLRVLADLTQASALLNWTREDSPS
jgi:ABC-type transporter Mla MlaB component